MSRVLMLYGYQDWFWCLDISYRDLCWFGLQTIFSNRSLGPMYSWNSVEFSVDFWVLEILSIIWLLGRVRFPFFKRTVILRCLTGSWLVLRESGTHSRTHDSCHVSTFGSGRDIFNNWTYFIKLNQLLSDYTIQKLKLKLLRKISMHYKFRIFTRKFIFTHFSLSLIFLFPHFLSSLSPHPRSTHLSTLISSSYCQPPPSFLCNELHLGVQHLTSCHPQPWPNTIAFSNLGFLSPKLNHQELIFACLFLQCKAPTATVDTFLSSNHLILL